MGIRTYGKFERYGTLAGIIMDILASILSFEEVEHWIVYKNRDELRKRIIEAFPGSNVILFVSEFFQKTITLNVLKNPEEFIIGEKSVKNFFKQVFKSEIMSGNVNFDLHIDEDIWKEFEGITVPGIVKDLVVVIYRLLVSLNNNRILDEAKNVGIKKVYTFLEALTIILQAILCGEVDEIDKSLVVYFQVKENNNLYRFRVVRRSDRHLGINMYKANPESEWKVGHRVCFGNSCR